MGAPAVWPTRIFLYDDPVECLESGINRTTIPPILSQPLSIGLSVLQYLLAAGAIVNLIQLALELGRKTVITWSCDFDYGPLAWTLMPLFIHALAAVSYRIEISRAEKRVKAQVSDKEKDKTMLDGDRVKKFFDQQDEQDESSWWKREFTLCANQAKGLDALLKQNKLNPIAVFFNCAASACAFIHLLFGTMLFPSLLFIAVYDILNFVLWRYLVSTVICRLILLIELSGMRESGLKDVDRVEKKVQELKKRVDGLEEPHGKVLKNTQTDGVERIEGLEMRRLVNSKEPMEENIKPVGDGDD
jgi:hypothetical protein